MSKLIIHILVLISIVFYLSAIEDDVDYNAVTSDSSNDQKMHKHQLKTNGDLRISAQILANKHSQYNEYRYIYLIRLQIINSTLKKWDERTRLAIGGRKMTAKKDFTAFDTSILDQIDKVEYLFYN
jgi:hypothetical protein